MWRDPQEVVSSLSKASQTSSFFKKKSLVLRSVLGFEEMQKDTLTLRRTNHAVLDFCYEELVENTERTLCSICAFLELPFDPAMMKLADADNSMLPAGEHHIRVKSGEISPTRHQAESSIDPIRSKIERYLERWRLQFGNQLESRRYWNRSHPRPPTTIEAAGDRFRYRLSCLWGEFIIPIIYGLAPTNLLRAYRRIRNKNL
jgi:hypothetical protein